VEARGPQLVVPPVGSLFDVDYGIDVVDGIGIGPRLRDDRCRICVPSPFALRAYKSALTPITVNAPPSPACPVNVRAAPNRH
jgi:hypothetical protein